jgi:hypothetical protein
MRQHFDFEPGDIAAFNVSTFMHEDGHNRAFQVGMMELPVSNLGGSWRVNQEITAPPAWFEFDSPEEATSWHSQVYGQTATMVAATLSFFNCRNIELRRLKARNDNPKFERKTGVKKPEYHVIEVHKQTVRNVYEGGISKGSALQQATLIAGHYKRYGSNYGDRKKLFGKLEGKWFWQSRVRGTIGTPTVNDYRVWEPQHKDDCKN